MSVAWLVSFPWATLGRREAGSEFFKKCNEQRGRVALLGRQPVFSLVVLGEDGAAIRRTVEALEAQSYPYYEIVYCEGTTAAEKNSAAKKAKGDWVGFIDAGDVLSPAALYQFALDTQVEKFDLIYCNEAVVSTQPGKIDTFLSKPAFSWVDLIHFNYVGRFWAMTREKFTELGGFDETLRQVHEHDLLLRLAETDVRVKNEPYFFYYRRSAPVDQSSGELIPVVERHLARRKFAAAVTASKLGVRVRPKIVRPKSHLISGVICFRNRSDWTIRSARAFAHAAGKIPTELFLVNNQSDPRELAAVRAGIADLKIKVEIVDYDRPFNFGNMHNVVVKEKARGDFLFLLNNDVFLETAGLLDDLAAWAQLDWVGTVGMLLRFPHGGVQHGGFRALFGGEARMARVGHVGDEPFSFETREVFGNSFAACLIKRETYSQLGGLRELDFPNGFGDVAFNFEGVRRGMTHVYVGQVEGVHLESASRGLGYEYWEECGIEEEYADILRRMLREDLGYNRVPGADFPIRSLVRQAVTQKLAERLPWLLPWKPRIKKMLKLAPKPI